jgi:hypothetical protein
VLEDASVVAIRIDAALQDQDQTKRGRWPTDQGLQLARHSTGSGYGSRARVARRELVYLLYQLSESVAR